MVVIISYILIFLFFILNLYFLFRTLLFNINIPYHLTGDHLIYFKFYVLIFLCFQLLRVVHSVIIFIFFEVQVNS